MDSKVTFSSGIKPLDGVLNGIWAGDNVVWQVDRIEDYVKFVHPFCRFVHESGIPLVYFRFANHEELLPPGVAAEVFRINPQQGFEYFITEIFKVIERFGKGVAYVFDSLSGLSVDWYSDRMLANFFMLTCPYLYDMETATYFALFRNYHIQSTINAIHTTAQIIIDVYNNGTRMHILPIKVWKRHSPTMYMLHSVGETEYTPVLKSTVTAEILSQVPQPWLDYNIGRKDTWTNTFMLAAKTQEKLEKKKKESRPSSATALALKKKIIRMNITRDEKITGLCHRYFELSDLIEIGKRMIGSGYIGGKSLGMLLSRAILTRKDKKWSRLLETHDSFFVGSDVYYTYIIQNKCWWDRQSIRKSADPYETLTKIKAKLLKGDLPSDYLWQLQKMLNYFGQSPMIVRSSSLLEDAYGNAFSGKYESIFCVNQSAPDDRLKELVDAIRTVYASTMNDEVIQYRSHWNLMDKDEQMGLLIQRVSGSFYDRYYFPQVAGVGYSFNPFVWNSRIDPAKGVLRLVFGLGTRAVDRQDTDYARVVALNEPFLRPETTFDEVRKYSQRNVDVLDLSGNQFKANPFEDMFKLLDKETGEYLVSRDSELEARLKQFNVKDGFPYLLTYEKFFNQTSFVSDMAEMLATLEDAYKHPVDIEFTANFNEKGEYRINLLQCRPLQVTPKFVKTRLPKNVKSEDMIIRSKGPVIGQNLIKNINRIIYVLPTKYGQMNMSDRYLVARIIGKLTNMGEDKKMLLLGPGRWGTSMPALGIPVTFYEIRNASVLCEIVEMHEGMIPDISLGTHFFNDLIEMHILYIAVFKNMKNYSLNEDYLLNAPNRLKELLPDDARWAESIRVIDRGSHMYVNPIEQEFIVY